jgi:uncharacterized membrane protein
MSGMLPGGDAAVYLGVAAIALVTLGARLGGAALMARAPMTDRAQRFLDGMAAGVMAALVATIVARGGARELAAVGAAALTMLGARNATLSMAVGMAVAAAWTALV